MFNYHDLGHMGVDRAQMNKAVFAALKSGGLYVIADHSGRPGTGISECEEVTGAGDIGGGAHEGNFGGVFRAPRLGDLLGEAFGEVIVDDQFEGAPIADAVAPRMVREIVVSEDGDGLGAALLEPGFETFEGEDREAR